MASGGRWHIIRKLTKMDKNEQNWYWLAINGASVAASAISTDTPVAIPTPEQFLGYRTRLEQLDRQHFLLNAPIRHVEAYMTVTVPEMIRDEYVRSYTPEHPEPATFGPTAWLYGREAREAFDADAEQGVSK